MTEKVAPGEDQKYPLPSLEDLYESDSHFIFFRWGRQWRRMDRVYQAQGELKEEDTAFPRV